jgi:hypothetical protein
VGDNKIRVVGLPHIHYWQLVDWSHCIGHFQMREVHLIMSLWIYFWPKWKVYLVFSCFKHFFTFQVWYFIEKTRAWGVLNNCISNLDWVPKLTNPMQAQFILI